MVEKDSFSHLRALVAGLELLSVEDQPVWVSADVVRGEWLDAARSAVDAARTELDAVWAEQREEQMRAEMLQDRLQLIGEVLRYPDRPVDSARLGDVIVNLIPAAVDNSSWETCEESATALRFLVLLLRAAAAPELENMRNSKAAVRAMAATAREAVREAQARAIRHQESLVEAAREDHSRALSQYRSKSSAKLNAEHEREKTVRAAFAEVELAAKAAERERDTAIAAQRERHAVELQRLRDAKSRATDKAAQARAFRRRKQDVLHALHSLEARRDRQRAYFEEKFAEERKQHAELCADVNFLVNAANEMDPKEARQGAELSSALNNQLAEMGAYVNAFAEVKGLDLPARTSALGEM